MDTYSFQPLSGRPMLQWRGKSALSSIPLYPAKHKERYGKPVNNWRNRLYLGDNFQVLGHLLGDFQGKIDLIYIDPPYDSRANYKQKISLQGIRSIPGARSFHTQQYSDRWNEDDYLQFMYERLIITHELLADTGSLFLHCDWHKSHHLRCILDEIFGPENLCNEIIRKYSVGGKSKSFFARKHDTIFFYAKQKSKVFFCSDDIRVPFTPHKQDKSGRNYGGKMGVDEEGRPYVEKWGTGKKKRYRYYLDEGKIPEAVWEFDGDIEFDTRIDNLSQLLHMTLRTGLFSDDVWDSQTIQSAARERTGYPTQKPEALLERIIKACSPKGGLVLDFFMGSGTTQTAAMKQGRRFLGVDNSNGSLHTTMMRLLKTATKIHAISKPQQSDAYTNFDVFYMTEFPLPTDDKAIEISIHIQHNDLVIQGFHPKPLLAKLHLQQKDVDDWRKLVDSILIDWNYNGSIFQPEIIDIAEKNQLVAGKYSIPTNADIIRLKITDHSANIWEKSFFLNKIVSHD